MVQKVQRWEETDLEDIPRSGRPITVNPEAKPSTGTHKFFSELRASQSLIVRHLLQNSCGQHFIGRIIIEVGLFFEPKQAKCLYFLIQCR